MDYYIIRYTRQLIDWSPIHIYTFSSQVLSLFLFRPWIGIKNVLLNPVLLQYIMVIIKSTINSLWSFFFLLVYIISFLLSSQSRDDEQRQVEHFKYLNWIEKSRRMR